MGVYVHNGMITACNVGDSRLVLGTMNNNDEKIQAVPLSKDHTNTPYRQDEAARCRAAGSRIMSMGQIDPSTHEPGDEVVEDPPRVWAFDGKNIPVRHLPVRWGIRCRKDSVSMPNRSC